MTILIAGGRFYNDWPSGSDRIALDQAIELARRGNTVWMLAMSNGPQPEYEIWNGIHLLRYTPAKVAPWSPERAHVHRNAIHPLLKRYLPRVDAIHGHLPVVTDAVLDFYGDSVPLSYTVHSPSTMELAIVWRDSGLARRLASPIGLRMIGRKEKSCLQHARIITALSQYTIDCIGKIHGQEIASRMLLIPGWVDTDRFQPAKDRDQLRTALNWPLKTPVLFTLRRLESRMGLDRLLDASHQVMKMGCEFHLMIGGSGSLRGKLETQVRDLGLSGNVTFLGRVDERDLPSAYAACDAFVLPTTELECFGLIAIEALAAGSPVLATPVGAIPEVLQKFEPSWLAKSAETGDIAELLRSYLAGELPKHSSTRLHEQAQRQYNCEQVMPQFIEATLNGYG